MGTLNLLQATHVYAPHAWFHNCSSSEVYGKIEPGLATDTDESCPFSPSSPYSISKATADLLGRYYATAHGLRVLTTRMFTHTGPRRGDVFMESNFAKQIAMIEVGQADPPVRVGNLRAVRTIADVRDAVRAYHMLLTVNPQRGAVYNIGGVHTCTAGDVLDALFGLAGFRCEVKVDTYRLRPIDADHQVPDCSRFVAATGWKPQIPFEQTMRDLLDYWREEVKCRKLLRR
jgi:GDPmannose 4,6-dehydratase